MDLVMRNLIDVIDQLLSVVPKSEKQIRNELLDIQDSQKFRAPEDMIGWYQVTEILQNFTLNKTTPLWQLEMCSIFSTQPLEKIKREVYQYDTI